MKETNISDVWRLRSHLSVEDAAILMAGGDPEATDEVESEWSNHAEIVKRTTGHPGFAPAFEALKGAIRRRELSAIYAHDAEFANGFPTKIDRPVVVYLDRPLEELALGQDDHAFDYVQPPAGENLYVHTEPDWSKTEIAVDDLKTWLRSRGYSTGFFFSYADTAEVPDKALDSVTRVLDRNNPHFAPELALALSAWLGLENETVSKQAAKTLIGKWIDANVGAWQGEGQLSPNAKDRILVVANWNKKGGAPEQ